MDRMKLIAGLVVLCLVSSVAAFLLPTAAGALLCVAVNLFFGLFGL